MSAREQELLAEISRLRQEVRRSDSELEIERLRLAACGVAALGYFEDCKDEYRSASLQDTLKLRSEVEKLRRENQVLRAACGIFDKG